MTMLSFRPLGCTLLRQATKMMRCTRPSTTRAMASSSATVTIGILRETYGPWERRCPLTPNHVRELLQRHPHVRVLVQPCQRRVFPPDEYERVGAVLTNDLSEADMILGVKRPADTGLLLPEKTYMFFSHTIKGQPENMPLLKACLEEHVQLMDYERLLDDNTGTGANGDRIRRLVSFGRFAGLAGAIDTIHGLGRRLLTEGQSTPFLSCPPAILCDDLEQAQERFQQIGHKIISQGLHREEPLVMAVTGKGGTVHGGVMEMLDLLPHEVVSVEDLPVLFETENSGIGHQQHKVYLLPMATADAFKRTDDGSFNRKDFQIDPSNYRSVMAEKVIPYTNTLINCAYWDPRFPRLLSKDDMRRLYNDGQKRLRMVSDISCDVGGSIEFLERSTSIDKPFFQYDPLMESETSDTIGPSGITILGVDILPTELPLESSQHFGNKLMGVLDELIDAKSKNLESVGIPTYCLSHGVANSAITTASGHLTTKYRYLQQLMKRAEHPDQNESHQPLLALRFEGHLFDSGVINQVLDSIEENGYGVHMDEFVIPKTRPNNPIKSSIVLTILDKKAHEDHIDDLESDLQNLIAKVPEAEATMTRVDHKRRKNAVRAIDGTPVPKALVLGSGFVARAALESLARSNVQVTLVSNDSTEAANLASVFDNVDYVVFDVQRDQDQLSRLIRNTSVVVSLLPAPMHPFVANLCLAERTHLVTSSYESDELRSMGNRMKEVGMICLNEVGLDPGLDHMSAMKIVDGIHLRGGAVVSFSSVCGGLPSPEAANNPFGYKFSWSPRGVLRASGAPARFLMDNELIEIQGNDLLNNARLFVAGWPEMGLEVLPNRDSLKYVDIYGIPETRTIFRGTLRYRGFSTLMATLRNMGLMDEDIVVNESWYSTLMALSHRRGFEQLEDFVVACAKEDTEEASRALQALKWLDMLTESPTTYNSSVVDAFCDVLANRLAYKDGERDTVVMHHSIEAIFDDGTTESHVSSLRYHGSENGSAMSQTVGYTAAAAVQSVLSEAIHDRGLLLPIKPEIYQPILDAVSKHGIRFEETVLRSPQHKPLHVEQHA